MRHTILPLALLLLSVAGHAGAQTPPAKLAAKAPAPLTLDKALTKLPPLTKGILLAVGADKVTLPDGTLPPPAAASPTVVANTFGDITQDFGSVTAIAPATHVLLNPNPTPLDMSVDTDQDTAFKMLAASLDDTQWKMLTSEGGLGLPDLTDDTQKLLFHALFPHGQLWVASQDPAQAKLPDDQRTDTRNVSEQINSIRVRMGQKAGIYVHDLKGQPIFFGGPPANLLQPHTWQPKDTGATQNAAILRASIPNSPKSSDLTLSDTKFQQTVTLTGITTVGDLVARIAAKTHTELYADPHYASRALTVIGPTPEASASDVLRALALAVVGTYRQVGPAFVLTDDLEGVGTRRRRLFNVLHGRYYQDQKRQDDASLSLRKHRSTQVRSLPTFGDPLAMTSDQMKSMPDRQEIPGVPDWNDNVPFDKLTSAQQDRVRQIADAYEKRQDEKAARGKEDAIPREPNPTGAVTLDAEYIIQFLVPTVQEPVDTPMQDSLFGLFSTSNATPDPSDAEEEKSALAKLPPAPPLPPLLRFRPHRAIIGHPTTPAAVDALIAAMQKIGLNELWLDVFSEGKSHVATKGTDILTEALTKTQGTGIAVYADLSLLSWGYYPPKSTWDLDILGQNSHFFVDYDGEGLYYPAVPPPVSASPVSATVKKTLTDMVRSLASRSGLAGFVWEDATQGKGLVYTPAEGLGYTLPMRLAFLRAFHADPVDITNTWYNEDLSLPTFDDSTVEDALTKQWKDARLEANALLLTELRQAIPASANKPILMDRAGYGQRSLMSWDDPHQWPPSLPPPSGQVVPAKLGQPELVRVTVNDAADTDALARSLQALLPPSADDKGAWDGYVLDFDNPYATDGTDPLRDLVRAAGPKQ